LFGRSIIYSGIGTQRVKVPSTLGEMFPVSNDVDGLQGLDPSLAICDELGFMPAESWNALVLASGKRPRSLVVGIGTPGYDKDNALWLVRRRAREGGLRPGFSFTEFAADEGCAIDDPVQWRKANPAMGAGYLDEDAMGIALDAAPSQAAFRIFKLGQWVDGVECWLGEDGRAVWGGLVDPFEFVAKGPTWVGVDVGLKHDSTAVVAGQWRPDGRLHAKARVWMPSKDETVDVTDVMQYLRGLHAGFGLQAVLFDPQFFDVPAKMLEDEGLPMVEVRQNLEQMTPLIGTLYELVKQGRFSHDGDPVFEAQVLNAVPRFNERGFTLGKSKSRGRIDAAVAAAMMAGRAVRHEAPPGSQVFFG
jgi:phage terminase large subunit-like protein